MTCKAEVWGAPSPEEKCTAVVIPDRKHVGRLTHTQKKGQTWRHCSCASENTELVKFVFLCLKNHKMCWGGDTLLIHSCYETTLSHHSTLPLNSVIQNNFNLTLWSLSLRVIWALFENLAILDSPILKLHYFFFYLHWVVILARLSHILQRLGTQLNPNRANQ